MKLNLWLTLGDLPAARSAERRKERKKKPGDVDVESLFDSYLKQIEAVVAHVDRLEK